MFTSPLFAPSILIMFVQKLIVSHMQVLLHDCGRFFMSDVFVAEKEADTQTALLMTRLVSWRGRICVSMNIYEPAGFQAFKTLVKTLTSAQSVCQRTLRNALPTGSALPLPSIRCTLSLAAPLVTTWPLSGVSGGPLVKLVSAAPGTKAAGL